MMQTMWLSKHDLNKEPLPLPFTDTANTCVQAVAAHLAYGSLISNGAKETIVH